MPGQAMPGHASPATAALGWADLGRGAGWPAWQRAILPRWLRAAGLLAEDAGGHVALTAAGLAMAQPLVRRHRLWEHYMQAAGGLPPGAAHRAADAVEHTLPPEVAAEAEAWLRQHDPGRLGTPDSLLRPGEDMAGRPRP